MFDLENDELDIKSIRNKLIECDNSYYNDSISILSDIDYDSLKDTLKKLSPNDNYFKSIGAKVDDSKGWKEVKHDIEMGSLNKVNTKEEFDKWFTDKEQVLVMTPKLDGMSIELIYENGEFKNAISRGDGVTGLNLTKNVLLMSGFPHKIEEKDKLSVRGEILISKDKFKKLNELLVSKDEKEYKSCRNAASGIAGSYDGKYCEFLDIVFYDLEFYEKKHRTVKFINMDVGPIETEIDTYTNKLIWLDESQFCVVYYSAFFREIHTGFLQWQNEYRNSYEYDLDGMVIRINDEETFKKMGYDGVNVAGAIAWKFESVKEKTKFLGYRWDIGKTKRITPVATFKPVNILGATLENASVHNVDYFKKYNLGVGDIIEIERANDVIPQIHKVIERTNSKRIELLTFCPSCGEKLIVNGAYLECENDLCPSGFLGNLEKYVDVLDIKDISSSIIEKLYKEKLIVIPSDFYKLTKEDFAKIPKLGLKVGQKIIDNFNAKKELDLPTFIASLNINGVSKSIIEKISNKGYDNIQKLQEITMEQLLKIQGIKDITAIKILEGLKKKKSIIESLLKYVSLEQCQNKGSSLSGKSFVFTGAINKIDKSGKRMKREYLQQIVRENGGLTPSSISKGVTYLVQADQNSMSTKSSKAKSYGIEILGEDSFFKILDENRITY